MAKRANNDPCWKGYEQAGTKEKHGKTVPNCIPSKKTTTKDSKYTKK